MYPSHLFQLERDEENRLLDCLEVDPFAKGDSIEGGIRYSELLRFCGRHAAQVGRDPRTGRALAGRSRKEALGVLRRALLSKVRPWCWIQDVRRLFSQFDEDQVRTGLATSLQL